VDLPVPQVDPETLAPTPEPTTPKPVPTGSIPNIPLGTGVGAMVLLAFLAEPFVGARLARLATAVTGGDAAVACPLEEP
jgi:hypothetical protein